MSAQDITETEQWDRLDRLAKAVDSLTLRQLFEADPDRGHSLSFTVGDLYVDLSKHRIDDEILTALCEVARSSGLSEAINAMYRGEHVNTTEDRAVLHTALRRPAEDELTVDGQEVVADVHRVLAHMTSFANDIRSGTRTGYTGKTIRTIVNVGIGGSDLGPAMVSQALRHYETAGINARFVSNVDPSDLTATLDGLDAETTLIVICSKTFTTQETLANATAARRWLVSQLGSQEAVSSHCVAVSTATEKVEAFGIDPENMFEFWDWVGGRYSVDSAIGLSIMITAGPAAFVEFLEGFTAIDKHFADAAFEHNVPVLMGLLGVWYTSFLGAQSKAVVPYSQDLARFPAYLQQLTMESNGKSTCKDGSQVRVPTGEVYWGEPGTNGQHAFFQLLHQGTHLVPVDFIGFARPTDDLPTPDGNGSMHDLLISNLFAQSKVLAFGKTLEELRDEGVSAALAAHKVMPGNRPSTTIIAPALTPGVLGQLIALYEHIVFTQSVVWGINAFDQWGVELGKKQAGELLDKLICVQRPDSAGDSSTDALIAHYRQARGRHL